MSNWEKQFSEFVSEVSCPCGKGTLQVFRVESENEYNRSRTDNEVKVTCEDCNSRYEYLGNRKWITKENYQLLQKLKEDRIKHEGQILDKLYYKHYNTFISGFPTRKKMYEFLLPCDGITVPGTIQTFYKHGFDYYIGKNCLRLYQFSGLLKQAKMLDTDDEKLIAEYEAKNADITNFIDANSVKV